MSSSNTAVLIIFIMLYTASLVLPYSWKFVPFDYLHLIPLAPPPTPLLVTTMTNIFEGGKNTHLLIGE